MWRRNTRETRVYDALPTQNEEWLYLTQSSVLGEIADTTMVLWGMPDFVQDSAGLGKQVHSLMQI